MTTVAAYAGYAGWLVAVFCGLMALRHRREAQRARTDETTGLLTRRAWRDATTADLQRRPYGGVVVLDLDGFKSVNDRYGYATGDRVLRAVADRLTQPPIPGAIVGRLGGDEIAVRLPDLGGLATLDRRLSGTVADAAAGWSWRISATVQAAILGTDGITLDALVEAAGLRVTAAKRRAGSRRRPSGLAPAVQP